jgi:hypothetical protein
MVGQGLVEIIDLEKDHLAIDFQRAEIVLFIRIVGVTKIIVDRDSLDDSGNRFGPKSGDACSDDSMAIGEVAAQFIIKRANAFGGEIHDLLSNWGLMGKCSGREARPELW